MQVFLSHNSADKPIARKIALELENYGVKVWFDEWSLSLGDSLSGGIEKGLEESHIFVLLWSENANKSGWVTAERRAYFNRRIQDNSLKIIPVLLDDTPLPSLLNDTLGYRLSSDENIKELSHKIAGEPSDIQQLQRLQEKFKNLSAGMESDPIFGIVVCPDCGSTDFERQQAIDESRDDTYYLIKCNQCGWNDWTQ